MVNPRAFSKGLEKCVIQMSVAKAARIKITHQLNFPCQATDQPEQRVAEGGGDASPGEKLSYYRLLHNLSQEELGKTEGCTLWCIVNFEKGVRISIMSTH